MSIFSSLADKIFHSAKPSPAPASGHFSPTLSGTSVPGQPDLSAKSMDVNAILSEMANRKGEKLNWKDSIVDLLKLVGMDSSLNARMALATELHYDGDLHDSARMNIWLQKQVMELLSKNGAKMPENLH